MANGGAAKPKPAAKRIPIEFPKDLDAVYSNGVMLTNTQSEVVIDFLQILPRINKGKAVARVILPPLHAKRLYEILGQSVANFEAQYGEIKMPPTLVDQLFSGPPNSEEGEENRPDSGDI